MNVQKYLALFLLVSVVACKKNDAVDASLPKENFAAFKEVGSIDVGDAGAAEISAFDPQTKKLFVVNNGAVNKIDVLDFSNPLAPAIVSSISMAPYGGAVNSVAVKNGMLAAAIEALDKQQPGKVAIFKTTDYTEVKVLGVGALPDMITYSPDGAYIITANEGEPNATYTNDPAGTVSIISVTNNYAVTTIDFSSFANQQAALKAGGLRIYGPNASFAQDMEPEYITVSEDSKTAWVTLQENNAIAKLDLVSKTVTHIFPLGFKNYNTAGNSIDPSDRDNAIAFAGWPVYGMYQPDAIAVLMQNGLPYLFTANEGDAREYSAFEEVKRAGALSLDATVFANGADLKNIAKLGRLNVTTALGDTDGDGDYDALYSLGARSFSVWNGLTGARFYDSGNELEQKNVAAAFYDDNRSDDKGIEPEGLTIGTVNGKSLAFIATERTDAVAVYDVTDAAAPKFLQLLKTGDAPEGVLFVSQKDSPVKRSLLIVSAEGDGVIKIYMPDLL